MNDESTNPVERELARFTPSPLSPDLLARLKDEPQDEPLTFADRVLVTFSSLGAIAASIILTAVLFQLAAPSPPQPSAADLAAHQTLAAEYQQLLAAR